MKNHFAVIGNPISHSKSPEIHTQFAKSLGIDMTYSKILATKDNFADTVKLFLNNGSGLNITVPFKEEAYKISDKLSDLSMISGAVNTLYKIDNKIIGDNTDGIGLVRDIKNNYKTSFYKKRLLIIGAGGATRGIILPIILEKPSSISIVNRTYEKALNIANIFKDKIKIESLSFNNLEGDFDIIINATSAILENSKLPINSSIFTISTFAYDMMYGKGSTPFLSLAEKSGANIADGLGMLVEQAAKSFEIWHNVYPKTKDVIKSMRDNI